VRNSDSATELLGTFLFEGVTTAAEKAQLVLIQVRDHVISHMLPSQGHMPVSQGHMEKSSSLLFGYSLALGADRVDLGVSHLIPS